MEIKIPSDSQSATEEMGRLVGQNLRGGEFIELVSDLGGGKTAFVRGLARGMGSTDHVSSPTFKISNVYKTGKGSGASAIYHFDFYRLSEPGAIAHELQEAVNDDDIVVAVEWPESASGVLPDRRLSVNLHTTGDHSREIIFSCPDELSYVAKGLN